MPPGDERRHSPRFAPLSSRQAEVIALIALGFETPEIARRLHISEHTVRAHVRHAMERVGARTRAHLVAIMLSADPNASDMWWPSSDESSD